MIKREEILKRIRPFYNNELIKVLIGLRRSGKSVLLHQIIEELLECGVDQKQIIYMNFEDFQYSFITGARDLYDQKVIDREFGAYAGIADNYPKYVISMDKLDFSREGIIHLNALTFLKDDLH